MNYDLHSMRKILVPVDFSDSCDVALALASNLPGGEAVELHLLHVTQPGNLALESTKTLSERNRQTVTQCSSASSHKLKLRAPFTAKCAQACPTLRSANMPSSTASTW